MIEQLYLKPDEGKFLAMAVIGTIEQLNETAKNPKANWQPHARKDLKDMLTAGNSLRIKLEKLGFDMSDLPPFHESDWNDFFTKES